MPNAELFGLIIIIICLIYVIVQIAKENFNYTWYNFVILVILGFVGPYYCAYLVMVFVNWLNSFPQIIK